MKNNIEAVRNLLIEGMERLLNPEQGDTFTYKHAQALAALGSVLVETAKAETQYMLAADKADFKAQPSGFLGAGEK